MYPADGVHSRVLDNGVAFLAQGPLGVDHSVCQKGEALTIFRSTERVLEVPRGFSMDRWIRGVRTAAIAIVGRQLRGCVETLWVLCGEFGYVSKKLIRDLEDGLPVGSLMAASGCVLLMLNSQGEHEVHILGPVDEWAFGFRSGHRSVGL